MFYQVFYLISYLILPQTYVIVNTFFNKKKRQEKASWRVALESATRCTCSYETNITINEPRQGTLRVIFIGFEGLPFFLKR